MRFRRDGRRGKREVLLNIVNQFYARCRMYRSRMHNHDAFWQKPSVERQFSRRIDDIILTPRDVKCSLTFYEVTSRATSVCIWVVGKRETEIADR